MDDLVAQPGEHACDKERIALRDFERSLGLLLRVAELSARQKLTAKIHASGGKLKVGEFTILHAIGENPGVRQGVLARSFHIKLPSMTNLVNSMEQRGLLERIVPPNDRRSVGLVLTDEGQERVTGQVDLMWAVSRDVFSMLSEEEHQALTGLLRKVAGWPKL